MFLLCCTFTVYPLNTTDHCEPGERVHVHKTKNTVARYLRHSFYSEANYATSSITYLLIMFVKHHFETEKQFRNGMLLKCCATVDGWR